MTVKELIEYLQKQPDSAIVSVYLDGSVDAEGQWLIHAENLDLETDAENAGKLPVPQLVIGLDAGDNLL